MKAQLNAIYNFNLGADPEVFIQDNEGNLMGSERVLGDPKKHINQINDVVVDGVQAEIHPSPTTCRQGLSTNIRACFTNLKSALDANGAKLKFSGVVEVPKDELKKLSEESQRLGCAPSLNTYDSHATITVDPKEYLVRSAGGHIHLGINDTISQWREDRQGDLPGYNPITDPAVVVPLFDLFCGNTCVLMDQDPAQVERRKNYGRAGEYRLPKHGIEYRVPSNFWLRHYTLMSLVMNLVRLPATLLMAPAKEDYSAKYPSDGYLTQRLDMVKWLEENNNPEDVRKAINENDYELALKNFEVVEEFVKQFIPESKQIRYHNVPFWPSMLPSFRGFVSQPMSYWFSQEPMEYWTTHNYTVVYGWESFVDNILANRWEKALKHPKYPKKVKVHA